MPISTLFDTLIWGLIALGLLVQIIILFIPFLRNNKKVKIFFIIIFICQIGVLYGSFVEPRMITVKHQVVDFEGGRIVPQTQGRYFAPKRTPSANGETLRIALIADWQVGPYKQSDYTQRAVQYLEHLDPDLLLMPGDFVYLTPEEMQFLEPLTNITSRFPTYATLGNHDYHWRGQYNYMPIQDIPEEFRYSQLNKELLESYGVHVLHNQTDSISLNNQMINLIGQEDWWATGIPLLTDFYTTQTPNEELTILLQHNPDGAFLQTIPEDIDLMVAGHTHGGQVRLPGIGALHGLPIESGNHIDRGWFQLHNPEQLLYITQGIGESGPRARLFAWPEIVIFDISIHE